MSNASIAYAEDTLGVHAIYHELQSVLEDMRQSEDELLELRKLHKNLKRELADITGAPSTVRTFAIVKNEVDETNETIHARKARMRNLRRQHESLVARLTELGGYFTYLASLKTAQSHRTVPSSSPW